MSSPESIHLSQGFATTASTEQMSPLETRLKSAAALTLGIIPFAVSMISMQIFKAMAALGSRTENSGLRIASGIVGIPAGTVMVLAAKVFGLAQQLVWGRFARSPQGDGINTRLAWYGVRSLPWKDLASFTQAFLNGTSDRSLAEWSRVQV